MKRLKKVEACGDYCVLITKLDEQPGKPNEYLLVLCNAVGCPLEQKTITIEPKYVSMSQTHLVIADS
jgi:WD repeat-containing protein 35